jgi:hypothetical protein
MLAEPGKADYVSMEAAKASLTHETMRVPTMPLLS